MDAQRIDRHMIGQGRSHLVPLIRYEKPTDVCAFVNGKVVSAAQFLADIHSLAQKLPHRKHVVNRLTNRYRFAVGFAAALLRNQLTLLPPNETPETMRELGSIYPDSYSLTEKIVTSSEFDQILFPTEPAPSADFSIPLISGEQIAAIMFTSGSTGEPHAHPRSWAALTKGAESAGELLGVANLSCASILATVAPQHSYGLESSVLLPLHHRLALTSSHPLYTADIFEELQRLPRPRIMVTTPIHLRFLMAQFSDLPPVDILISATAPLDTQLAAAAESRFHGPLFEIYGCAEVGQLAVRRPTVDTDWRSLRGVELYQDARGTWAVGNTLDRNTLLNDVIDLHGPQRFTLRGRTSDLVNIAGKRASLANLNYHLNAIDGVEDGIFVQPSNDGGEVARLVALAVAPTLTVQDIVRALRDRIDPIFLPRPLYLVNALPRNKTGKVTRKDIDALLESLRTDVSYNATVTFGCDEPFATGHFPGMPIVPGAILLEEILHALSEKLGGRVNNCEIRGAKFLRPVRPGDEMRIRWGQPRGNLLKFECWVDRRSVLTGTVDLLPNEDNGC